MSALASIRAEAPGDAFAITAVIELAFRCHPRSDHQEHRIVESLRRARALAVSLVAEADGKVVGHVAFSPVSISDGSRDWYGLGPVSVLPDLQDRGVGSTLIREGLASLKELGAAGCVVLGEPAYYGRFGFRARSDCRLEGVPAGTFQVLALGERTPTGVVVYHEAFRTAGRRNREGAGFQAGRGPGQGISSYSTSRVRWIGLLKLSSETT